MGKLYLIYLLFFSWSHSAYIRLVELPSWVISVCSKVWEETDVPSYQYSSTTIASYISECLFSKRTYASAKLLLHGVFINFDTCPFLFPQTFLLAISFSLSFGPWTSVIFYLVFEFLPVSCYPFSGCCECWLLQIKLCLHYKKDWQCICRKIQEQILFKVLAWLI